MAEQFIYETTNNRMQRFIALLLVAALIVTGIVTSISSLQASTPEEEQGMLSHFTPEFISDLTPAKQFVISMMSGMIIFPIPNELFFYLGLQQGNSVVLSVVAAVVGFVIGNAVTYFLGFKLSKQVVYLLSTKQIYELRRKVNKYGVYAIMIVNIIPSPSDILTFGLGIAKYNTKRLFFFLALANLIKFSVLAYIIVVAKQTLF